jgi:uncharacterized membrane protein YhaH (DUF805 family)
VNSNDEIPASVQSTLDAMNKKERKDYGLSGRIAFFIFIVVVIVAISAAIFVPFAIGASMSAGSGGGNSPLALIPIIALIGILVSGVFIFKK